MAPAPDRRPVPLGSPPDTRPTVIDRFDVELSTHGALRPGEPLRLTARVTAALATADARMELTLPDLEAAKLTRRIAGGLRDAGTPPPGIVGRELPPAAAWRGPLREGQSIAISTTVRILEPGYYRAVATVVRLSSEPDSARGAMVRSTAVRELWLLVDETRGSTRAARRLADLPYTVERTPGPYRRRAAAAMPIASTASSTSASAFLTNPQGWHQGAPGSYNEIAVSVAYYHPLDRMFRYAPGIPVVAELWRREPGGDRLLGGYEANTFDTGGNIFPCAPDQPDDYLVFRAELSSNVAWLADADPSAEVVATYRECGLEYFFLEVDAPHARVFLNLDRAATAASSIFGRSRSPVTVSVSSSPLVTLSRYTPSGFGGERITIAAHDVWDDYGTFVQAHEYGHAFHEKAWNGIVGRCDDAHHLTRPSSLQCADSEGIADFFSFVTLPETGIAREYGGVVAPEGTNHSTTEAYVAAVLGRLIDSAADPARPWDRVQHPGYYIGETIRTCTTNGVLPMRADGIDRLIYCLERGVDPAVRDGLFAARAGGGAITSQSSGAAVPTGWDRARIRAVWSRVLFGM